MLESVLGMKQPAHAFEEVWILLNQAFWGAQEDGCFAIAKAAAYSALMSFIPLGTTITTLLVQANAEAVSRQIAQFFFEVVPPGTEDIVLQVFRSHGSQPGWLFFIAAAASVWGASGFMLSLMDGFQAAYRQPCTRGWWRQRVTAVGLVFVACVPLVAASALLLFAGRVEVGVANRIGYLPQGEKLMGGVFWTGRVITVVVAGLAMVMVTSLLYRFGPQRERDYKRLWPGALMAALLWLAATGLFSWYVRNIASYNVLYGSIGAAIALLVWLYLLCVIALVGCEFNAEAERARAAGMRSFLY